MKIFRKIRFNTVTKKNFGKYFVYATGEIILVVIGILIALYLNGKKKLLMLKKSSETIWYY